VRKGGRICELERSVAENAVCGEYRRPIFQVGGGEDLTICDGSRDEIEREGMVRDGESRDAGQVSDIFGDAIVASAE